MNRDYMPKSMTGYGSVRGVLAETTLLIEAKSFNSKFFELNLRNLGFYTAYENKISDLAKKYFKRGRLDLSIREQTVGASRKKQSLDLKRLAFYQKELQKAGRFLKIPVQLKMENFMTLSDIWISGEEDPEKNWEPLSLLLKKCFERLEKMRVKEGAAIKKFFLLQLKAFKKELKEISSLVKKNVSYHHGQLKQRVQTLLSSYELDSQRLAQEFAYLVDRMDISEEVQRLEHHLVHFAEILKSSGVMGRKLDFLLQEMNRETNTLASKSQSAEISKKSVECKHLIEKMREQVQNIE